MMLTSYRKTTAPASNQDIARREGNGRGLPFDLALTRQINGEYVPVSRVSADLPDTISRAQIDYAPHWDSGCPDTMWGRLPSLGFANSASTTLDVQMQLAQHDRAVVHVIDDLRTQLLQTMRAERWSRIAVTAPTSGCGTTFTAVQLALSLSRIPDCRTILMDLNQRRPAIARMMGLRSPGDIRNLLSGQIPPEEYLVRLSQTLALGLTEGRAANASEILQSKRTKAQLDAIAGALGPDMVIYDLPPVLEHDDLSAFLPQVDGVLLIADATRSLATQIKDCERRLAGRTNLLGIILNRTRAATAPPQAT